MFFAAIAIFLALSYVMVVFALGYQYDFTAWKFVQTGSLRVVANTGAKVYLNNALVGNTSFLGNTYSKGRLLPRTYVVRLTRAGYHPWEKKIAVVAGLFADFPKIVLLPNELSSEQVVSSSFGFPTEESIAYPRIRTTNGKSLSFDEHSITVTWLDNTDYQPFHQTGNQELIARLPQKIDDIQWYKDREHLFILSNNILYFMEIDKCGGLNSYELTTLKGQFFYSEDDDAIYKMDGNQIVKLKF